MESEQVLQQDTVPEHQSYPAQSKSASGSINGLATEVTTTMFSDKIITTISQEGKIGQWFQVALHPRDPSVFTGLPQPELEEGDDEDSHNLLPMPHLGARTLLGASTEERETTGQLYATHIASSIMTKRPDETRILLVGLGLKTAGTAGETDRDQFFGLLELAMQTI